MSKVYTGIGSRETPEKVLMVMKNLAISMAKNGFTLRSGGADGADSAFEQGCDYVNGSKEIYLPWKGFDNNNSKRFTVTKEALELASKIHPNWGRCSQGAQKLHARDCYQVLGEDLKTPSNLLICWTKNGELKGGTATAIKLAEQNGIKVINLGSEEYSSLSSENLLTLIEEELK